MLVPSCILSSVSQGILGRLQKMPSFACLMAKMKIPNCKRSPYVLINISTSHEALNWPSLILSPMAHLAKAYPSFLSMKQIEILLPPPNLDGMLIYHKVQPPPSPSHFIKLPWQFTSTHLYSRVERDMMTVECAA